jgi:hypothetical protein
MTEGILSVGVRTATVCADDGDMASIVEYIEKRQTI